VKPTVAVIAGKVPFSLAPRTRRLQTPGRALLLRFGCFLLLRCQLLLFLVSLSRRYKNE
jgi:hypothetical protein